MNYYIYQLKTAAKDFSRNKVRTFLTSLGILIGVFSVVTLISIGIGLKNYIQGQFESLGSNLLFVLPGKVLTEGGGFQANGPESLGTRFDEKDLASLKRSLNVDYIVPLFSKSVTLEYNTKSESGDVFASSSDLFTILSLDIDRGELFTETDLGKRSKSVVIGKNIAEKLFGDIDSAVGQTVRFANQRFKVIGVLKEQGGGGFGGPNFDNGVYMPYTTAFNSIDPDRKFISMYVGVANESEVESTKKAVEDVMLKRYKEDDFSVIKQTELVNAINSIFGIINIVLVAIGSISLIVGGIGIMNIMYANVTERTKEIGIRRAIGATKRDILFQFLTESVLLSLLGGLIGLALASLVVYLVKPYFPLGLNATAVAAAIGISSAIGIFFGVFPARRAAALTPIEAIRYE